ncbi:complement C3-like, partial [Etheostoma cragini]|uniref:complement C3-like n=1 Tax=Etheostoma cragini TaxID=417921 RepID=UPI00155F0BAC
SRYGDALQRECCVDGMRTTPLSYTCERRAEYIGDGDACVQAFLFCCREMETQRAERKEDELILARTDQLKYKESDDITSRTNFPESWMWIDQTLPACPQDTPYCDT